MDNTTSDDMALLRQIANGNEQALVLLHQRYVNAVYSMALHILGDRFLAEEVTQDIFLKIWQKGYRYDPGRGRFGTWLLSVTRFAAIDRLRSEQRRMASDTLDRDEIAQDVRAYQVEQSAWERGQHLRLLLQRLPAEQRNLIELAYFGGLSHQDLAEYLGLPIGTVKSRLRLGLQKLRDLWLGEMTTTPGERS